MKKYTAIDLFAGCGGLSEGFMQTNKFEFLAHIEWELPMVKTLRKNLVNRWKYSDEEAFQKVIRFDMQKTDELINGNWSEETKFTYSKDNSKLIQEKGLDGLIKSNSIDVIIGGPPCQAYSLAGRAQDPNSMKDDYRNYLFESFVKIVDYYKPSVFVFENVPGILSAKPGDMFVIDRIFEAFNSIGYEIRNRELLKRAVYSSVDYEVPQDRKRVIIFGVKKDGKHLLEDFYSALDRNKNSKKYKTVYDAIYDMPKFKPLEKSYKEGRRNISHYLIGDIEIPFHNARYHNKRDIEIFKEWIGNSMNRASSKEKLDFYNKFTGKITNHNKYRNLEWDKPSPTIVAHLYKDGLMFIHPDIEQLRSITIREAALLQSFPIDFEFDATDSYCFKMIGNAVPVLFSKGIANSIINVLEEK